jgi:large subunit ribosomal protein L2
VQDFSDITKKRPEKSLTKYIKRRAGRSKQTGQITTRHRGGGAKRLYRIVDFKRTRYDEPAKVTAIEYDPFRNARIMLVEYKDGKKAYYLAPIGVKVDDVVVSSQKLVEIKPGNRMPLENIPVGTFVYNIEFQPGGGGKLVRGAGTGALMMGVEGKYAQLKLPSGERRLVLKKSSGTIGQVSNPDYRLINWGKAGRRRHLGWRPTVRGKAMNPVDHPHGGGEGAQPIGLKKGPKTKWGKKAMGVKTRKKKKASTKLIVADRRAKKRK